MNIQKLKSQFKENHKQIFLVAGVVSACIFFVLGGHFADAANSSFFEKFWAILAVVCGVGLIAGFVYEWAVQDKK